MRKKLIDHADARTTDALSSGLDQSDEFAALPNPDVGETIFDSGAARHLIAEKYAQQFPYYIDKLDQVIPLTTAAGPWSCDSSFHYRNEDSGATVDALVLPDTPTVLSIGILVIRDKWHFEWPVGSCAPFVVKPDGSIVWFIVRDYVLYLQKSRDITAIAAV